MAAVAVHVVYKYIILLYTRAIGLSSLRMQITRPDVGNDGWARAGDPYETRAVCARSDRVGHYRGDEGKRRRRTTTKPATPLRRVARDERYSLIGPHFKELLGCARVRIY